MSRQQTSPCRSWGGAIRAAAVAVLLCFHAPAPAAQPGADLFGSDPFADQSGGEVTLSVESSLDRVSPGDQLVVAVVLSHQEGWHSHTNAPVVPEALRKSGFVAIATEINVADSLGATPGPVQWPATHEAEIKIDDERTAPYAVFDGRATAYVPFIIDDDATGTVKIAIEIAYQACNEYMCLPPERTSRTFEFEVVPLVERGEQAASSDFAAFDAAVFADRSGFGSGAVRAGATQDVVRPTFFGLELPSPDGAAGLAIVALLAALGGFILNLTPCVLPVIPIKVMTISHHAGSPGKSLYLGMWMAGGVVGFWAALGVLAASVSAFADPSRVFGLWWFTLGVGVLIAVMGVGVMGAFSLNLPKAVYAVDPKADSAGGSFFFGVMTAVLGLPCFGFVAGALLAGAATLPALVVVTIFAAIGVGMALPYVVLSAKPGWVEKIPRTGPGSELVKQVMGLLLLAAASFFVGAGVLALLGGMDRFITGMPWWTKVIHWWFVALFALGAGGWLLVRTFQITKHAGPRLGLAVVGLVFAFGGVAAAADRTSDAYNNIWLPYTPDTLALAREEGRVVVLDFTAEWCLNCKALKAAVLSREPVKGQLVGAGVVPLVADVTSTSAPGWDKLRELGQTGIPLLVIYGPGLDEPWRSNAYTPEQVMGAIERARGAAPLTRRD